MTQEEKAKAYDEALERAKSFQQKFGGDYAGYIFPELRESEDERMRKMLIERVRSAEELTDELREWILTYLEKHKEQKPAEWSEEDKEMLIRCVAAIPVQGDEILPTSYLNKLRNWLESLPERFNLQSKQEWSEEDERMLEVISYKISQHQGNDERSLFTPDEAEFICGINDKLKSLRPSWKPSEEQMEALLNTLHPDDPYYHDLKSLYEQLKKL